MIFGSVCSGIEGASVAWEPLGWKAAWFAEVDPFASAVLAHRWPAVPNLGDFTRIGKEVHCAAIDVLVGGTPCQSFSVAGKRLGLDDSRGHLTLEFLALARRLRPRWVVWENVPGVLSDDGGRTFGTVLGILGQLGYGPQFRVLDAQHFGVPQRRRRVFVVGHFGAWEPAAAVLFEPACLRRDPPPSRKAGEDVARTLTHGSGGSRTDKQPHVAASLNAHGRRIDGESETFIAHSLRADGFDASEDGTGRGTPLVCDTLRSHARPGSNSVGAIAFHGSQDPDVSGDVTHPDPCHPLAAAARPPSIIQSLGGDDAGTQEAHAIAALRILRDAVGAEAFAEWGSRILDSLQRPEILRSALHGRGIRRAAREVGAWVDDGALPRAEDLPAGTVRALWEDGPDGCSPQGRELAKQLAIELGKDLPLLPHAGASLQVRRLTPREAERLQGFPDDYTLVPVRGGMAKDGPRYRALGNSFAVPVVRWIGERIAMVDSVLADGITEGYREGA